MDLFKIFRKFNDIDETYIYTDNHIHSNWTDGEGSVMKILKRSAEIGLNQIAITEHVRKESKFFDKYCEQVKNAKKCFRLNILEGFEAKIDSFNGELDVSNDILKKAKKPVSREKLVDLVLKQRIVRRSTVLLNLQDSSLFARDERGEVELK